MTASPLPIDAHLPEILDALHSTGACVLRAPTGSGKTTRLAPAVLDAGLAAGRDVLLLEPRRMAARAAARWIAAARGQQPGDDAGYIVRFDQRIGPKTKLKVVTDGVLLRLLQDDPFLESVGCVIFDEFHERRVNVDLAVARVQQLRSTVRPDLMVCVMSATAVGRDVARFLATESVIETTGRSFPVAVDFCPVADGTHTGRLAAVPEAVIDACSRNEGDVLVFLPGVGEIRRAEAGLQAWAVANDVGVHALYADLKPELQDEILNPRRSAANSTTSSAETGRADNRRPENRRRVILATNVAETSLTIPGITTVIDTGVHRQPRWDAALGLDRLELQPISRSSAEQRAGRAGRVAAGRCVRLWSEKEHAARPENEIAELHRIDLSAAALQVLSWGEPDLAQFPWFEAPAADAIDRTIRQLVSCGAVERLPDDMGWRLTRLGVAMARLPLPPRLARLMIAGVALGVAEEAAMAAALLSERDPFRSMARNRLAATGDSLSDVVDRVMWLRQHGGPQRGGGQSDRGPQRDDFDNRDRRELAGVDPGVIRAILQTREHLLRTCDHLHDEIRELDLPERPLADTQGTKRSQSQSRPGSQSSPSRPPPGPVPNVAAQLRRAIAAAYLDRLVKQRDESNDRGVMAGGRGVKLAGACAVRTATLYVALELEAGGVESIVWLASAVDRNWLPAARMRMVEKMNFDEEKQRVTTVRQTLFDDLVLDSSPAETKDDQSAANVLVAAVVQGWSRFADQLPSDVQRFVDRVRSLRQWRPDFDLPEITDGWLQAVLQPLAVGCRGVNELMRRPILESMRAAFTYAQLQTVEREAPDRLLVPSGNRLRVEYVPGQPPTLSARIQEMFGLAETPRIAGGKVQVVLQLLAPNGRPQQITTDLKSFWNTTYQQVRKELRARYPRHSWPEDPWTAEATRRPKRPGQ